MLGTSRESLAALQAAAVERGLGGDISAHLLKAASILSADKALRIAVVDAGQPIEARQALIRDLFASRITGLALDILLLATERRWADADDIVEALEQVAAAVLFRAAEKAGQLDQVEAEIFKFGRAVDANPELQMALTNPALSAEVKAGVVRDVVGKQLLPATLQVIEHAAANLRGRRVDVALAGISEVAAEVRNRLVAQVRVAIQLTQEQSQRLAAVLARLAGKPVSLNVIVDPSIVGGVSVRLGDEVIDGSVRTKLDHARRVLVG